MFFSLLLACTFFDNPPDVVNEAVSLYVAEAAIQISTADITQIPINSEEHFIGWMDDNCDPMEVTPEAMVWDTGSGEVLEVPSPSEQLERTRLPTKLTRPLTLVLSKQTLVLNQQEVMVQDFAQPKTSASFYAMKEEAKRAQQLAKKLYDNCHSDYDISEPTNILMVVDPAVHQSWVQEIIEELNNVGFDQFEWMVQDPSPRSPMDVASIPISGVNDAARRLKDDKRSFKLDSFEDYTEAESRYLAGQIILEHSITQHSDHILLPKKLPKETVQSIQFGQMLPKYLGLSTPPLVTLKMSHQYPMTVLFEHWNAMGKADVYCVSLIRDFKEPIQSLPVEAKSNISKLEIHDDQLISVFTSRLPEGLNPLQMHSISGVRCSDLHLGTAIGHPFDIEYYEEQIKSGQINLMDSLKEGVELDDWTWDP